MYEKFERFLEVAIKEYYQKSGRRDKAKFIALLLASGQTLAVITNQIKENINNKTLAAGAILILALRLSFKYLIGGPAGLIISGLTVASLISFLAKNRKQVTERIPVYKELISNVKSRYEEVQSEYAAHKHDDYQRNLMIDGLMKRFLDDIGQIN